MPQGPRLNLTQLTTLRELVRRGTLAAAADHLGYTPGAVSQHLASLEAALGVALVERSGRHLVLTDAGRVMAEHAVELLAAEARAVSATRSAHDTVAGPLVVGTWGSTAATLLAPIVQRMAAAFPEVSISSREVDLDSATASVRYGEVDVAFGLDYPDAPMPRDKSIQLVRLQPEKFAVAVATGSVHDPNTTKTAPRETSDPAGHRDHVEIEVLGDLDWILPPETSQYGRAIRSGFRRLGFEPQVVHEVTDTAASLQLAAAGLGATVMTGLMRRLNTSLDLTTLHMREPLTRQIVLISRGDVAQRQPVRVFVEEAESLVDELLAALSW
jgi:DNA-binding transcriptional LysR family regulator